MTHRSLKLTALLALLTAPLPMLAQETTANEDERIEQLVRTEASQWYTPKNSVSVGFRLLSSGVHVRFGNLGSIPLTASIDPSNKGNRIYDNGYVNLDALRAEERNSDGSQKSQPGGRYQTFGSVENPVRDANGTIIGSETVSFVSSDSLSYTPGLTRVWGYSSPGQETAAPGFIAMSAYSASPDGGFLTKDEGPSSGVELAFSHAVRKIGKHTELSIVTGIDLNGINSKTTGDVRATLVTYTDFYSRGSTGTLNPPANVSPSTVTVGSLTTETTTPISTDPGYNTLGLTPGGTTVNGTWQIKGAYFMVRVGPSLRTQFTERFGVSGSLGLAGAFVGTHYSAIESMKVPLIGTTLVTPLLSTDATKFLGGYYADFNLDWTANDTLSVYGGVSGQKLGSYTQSLGSRTALIDLGAAVGFRGGLNIKF